MKKIILFGAVALMSSPIGAALAVPMCDAPRFDLFKSNGDPLYSEQDLALAGERALRAHGIDANQTRFWNGCLQTFVDDGTGPEVMRFYDPDTYAEIPVN